jgi:DNA-nicking Smr family endonuclease
MVSTMDKDTATNTPFANLPKFVQEHQISLTNFSYIGTETRPEDAADLFNKAMQDVKTIDNSQKRIYKKHPIRSLKPTTDDNDRKLLEDAIEDHYGLTVTNVPEYMEGYIEGMNPLTMEKLRKGEFSVQRTLDLHGYSTEDADELFQLFIRDIIRAGLNCVKIIHGRGLKSKGSPVLKEHLKTWIIRAMHRKWVIAFSNAVMRDGGPGATYILLKNKPVKKQIHIIG